MQDKTALEISEELRQYIEALIEEVVLEGKYVENHKKYLRRYLAAEGVDYSQFETRLSELFETAKELVAQKSRNSECILRMQCRECYLSEDQAEKLVTTISGIRSEAEARRRAEEEAARKAREAEQRAREEAERTRKEREDARRKAEEIKTVERKTLIHDVLLCMMVLLISYFEFTTFKKWGWAFVPLLVNIGYSFFRIINVMDCLGRREFKNYEYALSFITFLVINLAAFCFPNAWSLAVLVPIPVISLIIDSAVHERSKEDRMITIHHGLLFTLVLLITYIEFAAFDSWGWAFVPLAVNIAYSYFRGVMVEDECWISFNNYEFVLSVATLLVINIAAFCFPNAWSLLVLVPIPVISLIIDTFVHEHMSS